MVFKFKYWGGKIWWNIVDCDVWGWVVVLMFELEFFSFFGIVNIIDVYVVDDGYRVKYTLLLCFNSTRRVFKISKKRFNVKRF